MSVEADRVTSSVDTAITVGVIGQPWRASVSPWGSVTPWGEAVDRPLDWAIAADDRWHIPARETAVRQHRLDGAPIVETRVRIPDGDAVQRVWSVADRGGLTIVEIENDSPLPFALAFFGRDVLTERMPTDIPIQGIDLPVDAITLPVAHHTSIRVAVAHGSLPAGVDPHQAALASLSGAEAVMRGWSVVCRRASHLDLPDVGLAHAVTSARCDLLLEGPVDPDVDPLGFVLDVGELIRCGDDAAPWLPEIVAPLEQVARSNDPQLPSALDAARRVAIGAGDQRADRDIAKLEQRVVDRSARPMFGSFSELERGASVGRFVADVERRLADRGDLLPLGLPASWLGVNFEMHGIPTSPVSTVSLAVRWHGERPAVLWEQTGPVQRLTAAAIDSEWSTETASGEGLWAAPRSARSSQLPLGVGDSVVPQPDVASPLPTAPDAATGPESTSFS